MFLLPASGIEFNISLNITHIISGMISYIQNHLLQLKSTACLLLAIPPQYLSLLGLGNDGRMYLHARAGCLPMVTKIAE